MKSHIMLFDYEKEQKLLSWFSKRNLGGCNNCGATFRTPKNRAWIRSKGLTIPELDFNTLYFICPVFFLYIYVYIYSHIESVDIHSWQIRKNWFQNRNRSLCELCIQGAICEKRTCRVVFCLILYISLFCISFFFFIISRLSVLPEFVMIFVFFPSFVSVLSLISVSFIWMVVHLIGCTGLLGTDNWLANNSSNNIRAYDIQVLIYTLHCFFCFCV